MRPRGARATLGQQQKRQLQAGCLAILVGRGAPRDEERLETTSSRQIHRIGDLVEQPVRELAREVGRSPSTASDVLAALRRDGLIDATNAVSSTDLFWRVADQWSAQRVLLAALPAIDDSSLARPLRLGLDDVEHEPGWALTDSAAATAYGAGVAARSDQVLDFFVPDESVVRRATTLLGSAASGSQARATVRVAPLPAIVAQRVSSDSAQWPLAHPLFVALDLAQDVGRGREILDAWTPDGWARVW